MKKIALILFLAPVVFLNSCAISSQEKPVQGKFVFYSLRDANVGWASYILKNGQIKLLGKKITSPVFSPDGKIIAATTENGIIFFDEEGNQKDSVNIGGRPAKLRWSIDGKKILYSIYIKEERKNVLRLLDVASRQDDLLLDMGQGVHIGGIAYSPDGQQVLISADHKDLEKIGMYILNSDGTNLKKVSKYGLSQMWLPDGKNIIYYTNINERGQQINRKFGSFFKLNIETGDIEKLQDLTFLPFASDFKISKDGKYFYFSKGQGVDGQHIVLCPVDNLEKKISVTQCVPVGGGLSQDLEADWFQE